MLNIEYRSSTCMINNGNVRDGHGREGFNVKPGISRLDRLPKYVRNITWW